MEKCQFTILIPSYNEEESIKRCIEKIQKVISGEYEILVINDGSTDKTEQIVQNLNIRKLRIISHKKNKGLGAALRTGFKNARGEYIITIDADLTHNPNKVNYLIDIAKKNDSDLVIGSRYIKSGGMKNIPLMRVLLSKFFNNFSRVLFSTKIKDLTSGFRVYKKDSIEKINFTSNDFSVQIEIVVKMIREGYKITEVPYILKNREYGNSKAPSLFNLIKIYSKTILELIK